MFRDIHDVITDVTTSGSTTYKDPLDIRYRRPLWSSNSDKKSRRRSL